LRWLAEDLVNAGFRVLTYDLYGRGLSDPHPGTHNASLYTSQLSQLLAILRVEQPFYLVGFSMGGAIAAHYSAENIGRIRKLVLVSPAGMPFEMPFMGRVLLWPFVGEFLSESTIGKRMAVRRAYAGLFLTPEKCQEQFDFVQNLTKYHAYKKKGYFPTILADVREFPLNNCTEAFRAIGEKGNFPVKLLWGTADTTTPYTGAKEALTLIPRAKLFTLEGGSHMALLEEHALAHPEIIQFLKQ